MEEDKIRTIFQKEGIEREIKCPQAFVIAEKYGIAKKDLAEFCNMHGIKIRACQLGCFK
ncbi:MAG TPA: hypothetical protein VMS89_06615 [Methanoregulaceae archaeon]|nr:hypothetical protein [Methanoregulaceae archaeon]